MKLKPISDSEFANLPKAVREAIQSPDHDKAMESDRQWFEQNPGRQIRWRKPVGVEAYALAPGEVFLNPIVVVRQLVPGLRLRILCDLGCHMAFEEIKEVRFSKDGQPFFYRSRLMPSAYKTKAELAAEALVETTGCTLAEARLRVAGIDPNGKPAKAGPSRSRKMTQRHVSLSPEHARLVGADAQSEIEPESMLDHAIGWASQGIHVVPCARFLGLPLIEHWYDDATTRRSAVIELWTRHRDADIAGVPDRSGHFVIVAAGEAGRASLAEIEDQYGDFPTEFRYLNRWGDEHLWLKGTAVTSHNKIGPGVHVLGAGHFVYLAPSLAPDPFWGVTTP